ncbi:MAG: hypothetical protein ACI3ZV_01795 [Paludibacteraceae bacterium]
MFNRLHKQADLLAAPACVGTFLLGAINHHQYMQKFDPFPVPQYTLSFFSRHPSELFELSRNPNIFYKKNPCFVVETRLQRYDTAKGRWWDLVRFGGIWRDLVGFGAIWWNLARFGGIWRDLVGFGGFYIVVLFLRVFICVYGLK